MGVVDALLPALFVFEGSNPCVSVCQFCQLSGTMTAIAGDWEGEAKEAENR